MRCNKIKTLIMTDYIDRELDESVSKKVEAHLAACANCRDFIQSLQKAALNPLRKASREMPPDSVWRNIKEKILAEELNPKQGLIPALKNYAGLIFSGWKPAVTLIVLAVITLAVVKQLPFNGRKTINNYLDEQMEFINYLGAESNGFSDISFDTAIEEYFL